MTIIIIIISLLIGVLISFLQYKIKRLKLKKVKEAWISCRENIDNAINSIENKRCYDNSFKDVNSNSK